MNILVGIVGLLGIILVVWGTQTRGEWSQNIGIIGGILWVIGVIGIFFLTGIGNGCWYLLATFIVGAILQRIFPKKI